MVCFYHTGSSINVFSLKIDLDIGVIFFFVISGYLILGPFLKNYACNCPQQKTKQYLWRRFSRIAPPFWISLLTFASLKVIVDGKFVGIETLLTRGFFVGNIFPCGNFFALNGVYWTLALEMQFYLMVPGIFIILDYFKYRVNVKILLSIMIFGSLAFRSLEIACPNLFMIENSKICYRMVFSFLDLFCIGGLVYLNCFEINWIISIFIIGVTFFIGNYLRAFNSFGGILLWHLFIGISFSFLMKLVLIPGTVLNIVFSNKIFNSIGIISYSIYLYHLGFQFIVFKFISLDKFIIDYNLRCWAYGIVSLPLVIMGATLCYYAFEKPFVQLCQKK